MTADAIPVLTLEGDAFARGRQLGVARREAIRRFLADGLARLDAFLAPPPDLAALGPSLDAYGAAIAREAPALSREIDGLAAGAGIGRREAVLLQVRREIAGYSRLTTAGDCTAFACAGPDGILAQTVDLAADMDEELCVLRVCDAASGRSAAILSFTGLLGYLGVNDRGLAVGLNLVLGGDWRPGLPPYLAIRHLLDTCGSVDEAVTRLGLLDLASSRTFVLCDRRGCAYVEALAGEVRVRRGPAVAHTNHFLAADFAPRDAINPFAGNGSRRRLAACEAWLSGRATPIDPEAPFGLFGTEPILVPDARDRRREKTVASVVLETARLRLRLRRGDPRGGASLVVDLPSPATGIPTVGGRG